MSPAAAPHAGYGRRQGRGGAALGRGAVAGRARTPPRRLRAGDDYVRFRRMRRFGVDAVGGTVWLGRSPQSSLTGVRALRRHLALTLSFFELDAQDHTRSGGDAPDAHFGWATYALGAGLRGMLPLLRDRFIP